MINIRNLPQRKGRERRIKNTKTLNLEAFGGIAWTHDRETKGRSIQTSIERQKKWGSISGEEKGQRE